MLGLLTLTFSMMISTFSVKNHSRRTRRGPFPPVIKIGPQNFSFPPLKTPGSTFLPRILLLLLFLTY